MKNDKTLIISSQKMKLINAAGEIQLDPDKIKAAFMARQLVQATLPHRNPGDDVPAWSRKNGSLTLTIRPGWDNKKKENDRLSLWYSSPAITFLAYNRSSSYQ